MIRMVFRPDVTSAERPHRAEGAHEHSLDQRRVRDMLLEDYPI